VASLNVVGVLAGTVTGALVLATLVAGAARDCVAGVDVEGMATVADVVVPASGVGTRLAVHHHRSSSATPATTIA
jgi:hypothetical protein